MNRRTLFLAVTLYLLAAVTGQAQFPAPTRTPFAGFDATPAPAAGATTPLNAPLAEETETSIACELTKVPTSSETHIFDSPKDADTARGVWHYKLWLPKGYLASPFKSWPCMFIMSPGGNAVMGHMADHLKAKGYVVVMLVESKNGPWGPVVGDLLAAHDDVIKRVRITEGKKFATGQSGGARGTSILVQARPGFGGIIMQSAGAAAEKNGYDVGGMQRNGKLYVAMTMGDTDKNKSEVERMQQALNSPARFRAFPFSGGHEWAPQPVFEQAIAWIEQQNGM